MKKLSILLCLIFIAGVFAGCANTYNPPGTDNNDRTNPVRFNNNNESAMTQELTRMAEDVPGVKNATVVISSQLSPNSDGMNNNQMDTNINKQTGTNQNDYGDFTDRNISEARDSAANPPTDRYGNGATINNRTRINPGDNVNDMNVRDNNVDTNVDYMVVLVGIELDNNNTGRSEDEVARAVEQKLKDSDNNISQVIVTTEPEMIKQINNISDSLTNGTPAYSIRDDLDNLTRDMTNRTR